MHQFEPLTTAPEAPEPPRWTLRNGRLLCYDGMSVARLYPATEDAELAHPVYQLDELARLVVACLNGFPGDVDGDPRFGWEFPVSPGLAAEVEKFEVPHA